MPKRLKRKRFLLPGIRWVCAFTFRGYVSPKICSCFRFHTQCTNMQRVTLWFLRSSTQEQPEGDRPYFEVNPTPLANSRYGVTRSETSHRTSPQAFSRMASAHAHTRTQPQTLKSLCSSFKRRGRGVFVKSEQNKFCECSDKLAKKKWDYALLTYLCWSRFPELRMDSNECWRFYLSKRFYLIENRQREIPYIKRMLAKQQHQQTAVSDCKTSLLQSHLCRRPNNITPASR